MIPKVIHYCWFGGKQLPELAQKCKESWKKFCPEYEIKEWNETNFDLDCCDYVKEAYKAKMWAFVSDYARLKILYEFGGLYFDTDVELIQPIDDIVQNGPFMGREAYGLLKNKTSVAPGLGMAVNPGLGMYKRMLQIYESSHFILEDGTYNKKTIVEIATVLLEKDGLKNENALQYIDGVYIYPVDFFSPMEVDTGKVTITKNTRSIHHYSGSWCSKENLYQTQLTRTMLKKYPKVPNVILLNIAKFKTDMKFKGIAVAICELEKKILSKVKR